MDGNAQGSPFIKLINCNSAADLDKLEEIKLSKVVWDSNWLSEIAPLKALTIASCYDYNGENLENLAQVENLTLFRCNITELSFINGMDSLTELTVEQSKLNNSCFDDVDENYSLKRLTLSETGDYIYYDEGGEPALTDITGVTRFKGLEYLYIWESHLVDREQQLEYVRAELPGCKISMYG